VRIQRQEDAIAPAGAPAAALPGILGLQAVKVLIRKETAEGPTGEMMRRGVYATRPLDEAVVRSCNVDDESGSGEESARVDVREPMKVRAIVDPALSTRPRPLHAKLDERVVEPDVREADHHASRSLQYIPNPCQRSLGIRQVLEDVRANDNVEVFAAEARENFVDISRHDAVKPMSRLSRERVVSFDSPNFSAGSPLDLVTDTAGRTSDVEHATRSRRHEL
jgi:hypothetical protein